MKTCFCFLIAVAFFGCSTGAANRAVVRDSAGNVIVSSAKAGELLKYLAPTKGGHRLAVGRTFKASLRVCVGIDGAVESAEVLESDDPLWGDIVTESTKMNRYAPLVVGGFSVAFCFEETHATRTTELDSDR